MNVSSKVPLHLDGVSLLAYLSTRFTYLPTETWRAFIAEGRISSRGAVCTAEWPVAQGDVIHCDLPEIEAPKVNLDYTLVYEDEWLLAVNKPPGLRVHSGGKFVNANLIYHLRHVRSPPYPDVNLVNRLDADTSGLILLAKEKTALRHLMRQFSEGTVEKRYLAVVTGRPSPADGTIDLPLGPVRESRVPRFAVEREGGKAAVTHYRTLRALDSGDTLLELHPETGRTHQLRVHLAAIGHPIAGDALYTMNDDDYLQWRRGPPPSGLLKRQALHSHSLQFFHPRLQIPCTLTAPLASDIEAFIKGATAGGAEEAGPATQEIPG